MGAMDGNEAVLQQAAMCENRITFRLVGTIRMPDQPEVLKWS